MVTIKHIIANRLVMPSKEMLVNVLKKKENRSFKFYGVLRGINKKPLIFENFRLCLSLKQQILEGVLR